MANAPDADILRRILKVLRERIEAGTATLFKRNLLRNIGLFIHTYAGEKVLLAQEALP